MALMSETTGTVTTDHSAETVNRADLVAAAFYGDVALPKGSPAWLAAAVEEQVRYKQQMPGVADWTIGQPGGGSLGQKSKLDREEEARAADIAAFRDSIKAAEAERERERWAEEMHSFGNVEMTGAEWSQLGDDLHHDTELRRWLVERLRRDGRSATDANSKANEIADVATIMGKPEGQRTAEEKQTLQRAESDPTFRKVMPELNEQRLHGSNRLGPTAEATASTPGSFALNDAPMPQPAQTDSGYSKSAPAFTASAGLSL